MQMTDKTTVTKHVLTTVVMTTLWLAGAGGGFAADPAPGAKPAAVKTMSVFNVQNLLTDAFRPPVTNCLGWGKWGTPFVIANTGETPAQFPSGITMPARSVLVHPGSDVDVAVGWVSPIAGKVSVRAKVTCSDKGCGDGVTWALVLLSPFDKKRVLARGDIAPGGSVTLPAPETAERLAALPVREGDGLMLLINRRGNYQCDSTLIELAVSEAGPGGRVWELGKDVTGDFHARNPHADSLGNAGVWHFLSGLSALDIPRELPGPRLESWTLATDDTRLVVGTTRQNQLCLYELGNPADGWNWVGEPSVFSLPVPVPGTEDGWTFKDAAVSHTNGQQVVIRFVRETPAMELQSVWLARPGRGPIRHSLRIVNGSTGSVAVSAPPPLFLHLAGPANDGPLTLWTFHTDGTTPDVVGVYRHVMQESVVRQIDTPSGGFIPYAVFDGNGKHGVYVGVEWSICSIRALGVRDTRPGFVSVSAGTTEAIKLAPGEAFELPPAFVGAYRGDVDDAGNSLRRYLFNYNTPEVIRKDASYPKVQWNGFEATGDKPGSWNSVEKKYYPLIDDIASLGFEEVMLDVGWWKGQTLAPEPEADPVDWPSGMAKAAEYAHKAGMRFGLYWNKGEDMATPEGRNRRIAHIRRLFNEYQADMWRSDSTGGPVIGSNYAGVKGFYDMLEQLGREIPNFQWENCASGGTIKDFGAMKYAVKVFMTDTYAELDIRKAFYDGSYAYPPVQLMGCLAKYRPKGAAGMRTAFRTMSMGAPEWVLDAPNGGNGTVPWTEEEKAAVKAAVNTYKTKIRPLVRNADLYHILPRPGVTGRDGIQYYDPATKKGVVYLFGRGSTTLKLRGIEPGVRYRVTFEDGSNPDVEKSGEELAAGLAVTLKNANSELIFLEPSAP